MVQRYKGKDNIPVQCLPFTMQKSRISHRNKTHKKQSVFPVQKSVAESGHYFRLTTHGLQIPAAIGNALAETIRKPIDQGMIQSLTPGPPVRFAYLVRQA
jgi:hypothetical protein